MQIGWVLVKPTPLTRAWKQLTIFNRRTELRTEAEETDDFEENNFEGFDVDYIQRLFVACGQPEVILVEHIAD